MSAQAAAAAAREYENIIVTRPGNGVGLITLNRPKALNALSSPLFEELNHATAELDADNEIGALIITGSERAFAGMLITFSLSYSMDDGLRTPLPHSEVFDIIIIEVAADLILTGLFLILFL